MKTTQDISFILGSIRRITQKPCYMRLHKKRGWIDTIVYAAGIKREVTVFGYFEEGQRDEDIDVRQ